MSRLANLLRRFGRHGGGATVVEYGLIVALLSIVVIAASSAVGVNLYASMSNLSGRIAGH